MVTDQACLLLTVTSPASTSEAMSVQENITSACHAQHLYYEVVHDNLQNFLGMCPAVLPFWQVSGRLKYSMRSWVCNTKILVNCIRKTVNFFTHKSVCNTLFATMSCLLASPLTLTWSSQLHCCPYHRRAAPLHQQQFPFSFSLSLLKTFFPFISPHQAHEGLH